ncbi:fimbrial protein [Atlantibacter hermannii]|uniref:fimbrial protein n=1 Tax=Atlantibacter hermannii TaxID=565 RepID=UPI0029108C79|nr:fimbrial protein [Atlantibacter hermannii]MDU7391375.1 fimbrial protein [Atlantibacter hermannii]
MKKALFCVAASTFLMLGAAHASTDSTDISANLTVKGNLHETPQIAGCTVTLDQGSVALNSNLADMPSQGDKAVNASSVNLVIRSLAPTVAPYDACTQELTDGHIAFKVTGVGDSVENTVLANTQVTGGAQGVGVGIYDTEGEPVPLNSIVNLLDSGGEAGIGEISVGLVKLKNQTPTAGLVAAALTIEVAHI